MAFELCEKNKSHENIYNRDVGFSSYRLLHLKDYP